MSDVPVDLAYDFTSMFQNYNAVVGAGRSGSRLMTSLNLPPAAATESVLAMIQQ
jgi:hypothetical protein